MTLNSALFTNACPQNKQNKKKIFFKEKAKNEMHLCIIINLTVSFLMRHSGRAYHFVSFSHASFLFLKKVFFVCLRRNKSRLRAINFNNII